MLIKMRFLFIISSLSMLCFASSSNISCSSVRTKYYGTRLQYKVPEEPIKGLWIKILFCSFVICFFFLHVFRSQYFFSTLNSNCSNLLDLRNLQEQVKKAFCYQKLFWPFTVWINCSSDLKNLEILGFQPRISNVFLNH